MILGGGPNYATAYFGMAKWFEGLTRPCHPQSSKNGRTNNIFLPTKTPTRSYLPPGAGRGRGLEQAQAARDMGSRIIIIGEEGDSAAIKASDIFFAMPEFPRR